MVTRPHLASERTLIQKIWQRVAEDYAPFGVDVTTEDPGIEGLRRTNSSDNAYGIRVVISPTNWYKSTVGGVAYVGSFRSSTDTPCFAFAQQLANNEKYIAEAVSHEIGHTVGLHHDGKSGTSATAYYEGQGNWAPIMGVGYYKAVAQFSKGEYAEANNLQDDLAVIASYVPLAADDHGNTPATASALIGPNVANGGTIETRNDVDLFRLDRNAGTISLNIAGPSPQPNLGIKAELLNSAGGVLQASDSATTLNATINATVPAGTYYLRIDGVGLGDPVTTGYSDYGSVGNYITTGSFPTSGTKQAPVAFSADGSNDPDGSITSYKWDFGDGTSSTSASASKTYMNPGKYTAKLTVTDNAGATASSSVEVSVAGNPDKDADVYSFDLTSTKDKSGTIVRAARCWIAIALLWWEPPSRCNGPAWCRAARPVRLHLIARAFRKLQEVVLLTAMKGSQSRRRVQFQPRDGTHNRRKLA